MNVFTGQSADEAWRQAASAIGGRRGTHSIGSRIGSTVELVHSAVEVRDPRSRWVTSRVPAINIAFALAEVIQILNGRDDIAFLQHWFPAYGSYVGGGVHAHGAYGARLRTRWEFDQLSRAADALSANEESRQVVLSLWNPTDDFPAVDGMAQADDIPCNVLSCLRLVDGRLHWLQTCRSNDVFRGLPYNLVQFTYIQEVLAGWIGVEVGGYTHVVSSLHAYTSALDEFSMEPVAPLAPAAADIRLARREADVAWEGLDRLAREMMARRHGALPKVPSKRIASGLGPLESIYWLLVAEDARRRGWNSESHHAANQCTDALLSFMWKRWNIRFQPSVTIVHKSASPPTPQSAPAPADTTAPAKQAPHSAR